jgi:CubicO group peptidase (beta-lactamase class C family)
MRTLRPGLFRFVLLALPLAPCLAQDPGRMDQIVQSYVTSHAFMGSVLVARGTDVLFSKGYGSANLEWDIANAPSTKFTAASILLLEERGKLSVTDPVKKYLPDAPATWDKITIFNLLTHTSGIPNFTSFPDYARLEPFPTTAEQLVARFRDKPLDFEPGSSWSYSNSGYVLLGYLLEKISGVKYETFVRDNIFTPLGMKESGYDSNAGVIPHRAAGYVSARGQFENAGFINMTVPHGAGGLYSTTEDLLKWEQGLFGGKLLRPASREKMTTPFKSQYAFGLQVDTVGGHKAIEHGGGIEGFNTHLAYYPDDKLTVVVLGNVNGSAPGEIAAKLAALSHGQTVTLAGERKEIHLDSAALERNVGAYRMTGGPIMLITRDGSQLSSKLANQQAFPIFPESRTMFFPKAIDAEIEFAKEDSRGRPSQLILHQGGRDMSATRLDDAESKRIADAAAAFAKRFKEQTPVAGGEAALRRLINEVRAGKPNYDLMSSDIAQATRQNLPQLQSQIVELGAVKAVTFKGVGPGGADIYAVTFEKGALEYRIWLTPDGKIDSVNSRQPQ